ncbi:hypothetical protein UPYG_G00117290 [Umbra pygmaea]|uniref:Uncharacterized protein n=1 Tax=Umbra pygmaea TaxID=75934 RepID=A0ABD0XJL0_UMBPY
MSANGDTFSTASRWFSSNIFIIFVVVLVLVLVVIGSVCCLVRQNRNRRNTAERVTEIEIISPGNGLESENQAKFTLKIKTDQRHATQLVGMLVGRVCHLERPGPDIPEAPATSSTSPAVSSPPDRIPSPAPPPVPPENMPNNDCVSQPTPQTPVSMNTTSPHPYYLNNPKSPSSREEFASNEEEDDDRFFYVGEEVSSEKYRITDQSTSY